MMTLTVKEPWASLIAAGTKRIENRTWETKYRGPLAIHAGKSPASPSALEWLEDNGIVVPSLVYGKIVAVVNLIDCVELDDLPGDLVDDVFAEGPWCWILADARLVTPPIAAKGKLGLWRFDGKIEVAAQK